jgi:hypothetical protein
MLFVHRCALGTIPETTNLRVTSDDFQARACHTECNISKQTHDIG